ncbi:hypothetical protein niasHT_031746 [Heterodera trifolii]|uniref:Uncharacterized protein n=1 Tax=Heterodera trifolii TaxID=157864 RepID=A0ABD2IGX1_9BILA
MAILRWSFLPIFFAMQWIKFNCTLCPIGLNCFYPRKYAKPVLCAHPNINNITDFLSTGQLGEVATTTTTTLSPTSEAAAAAECTTPPAHLTAWIAVCTALVALLVIAQVSCARRVQAAPILKDRAFEKGMLRRHRQRMRASRRNRQPASAPTPLILPAMLGRRFSSSDRRQFDGGPDGQRRAVGAEEEPVYDEVPLDTVEQRRDEENGEEDEEEDDSDF